MGKRKASDFTIAEYVTNWFEASCHSPVTTETVEGEANQVGTGVDITGPSTLVQTTTAQEETSPPAPSPSRLTAEPRRWLTASPHIGNPADVARPPRTDEAEIPGIPTTGELDPERAATLQAFWSLLEEVGYEIW